MLAAILPRAHDLPRDLCEARRVLSAAPMISRQDRLRGVLLGTAVGDSLGLPREGLSPRRAARLFGGAPLRHRFFFGRGSLSDDTEHAAMTAQALLAAPDEPARFARSLAWRLRGWLLALPPAVGWGTLRALVKLWLGFSPARSGVASAGNGPVMRAPLLGAALAHRPSLIAPMVRASCHLTHRDRRAEEGSLAIALAAAHAARGPVDPPALLAEIRAAVTEPSFTTALDAVATALERGDPPESLVPPEGVSGYVVHTVPAVLHVWLRSPGDFRRCVEETILLGGDADTTGAIVGGLAGAAAGAGAIPTEWLTGIAEWPRSRTWLTALADRLALRFPERGGGEPAAPLPLFWPALFPRNLLFLVVVLGHGLRRLLPPY
jgi:ADP-ribosylglycohydrolase